ncbi:RNA pyrophosphohydrolase [Devosia sp. MC521]|uniref:RNA pyrophosphohydrolase n=1 Tax=Devosia sp. MC521 TaxID=2759954 RepID=UPI0015F7B44B|nr:RNA pyrophosphohydrolase [Devosia sp. MC521]MBJ6988449.1 RNA pyrophosphohydrolase [Devosia sp. MC521]QMW62493.1 RNA pyrophosphohydrolase [Devosia sp. MC521]
MSDRPDRESLPYRDCVGVALFNAQGKVFLGHRLSEGDPEKSSSSGFAWQMPQGGIDKGEDSLKAALRELYEETDVTSVSLLAEAPEWIYYDFPPEIMGVGFKGKYRGQRQRWYAFAFTGDESEINVLAPAKGKHKPEFNGWRWEDLTLAPELIIPFKRDAYDKVVDAFADIPRRYFS